MRKINGKIDKVVAFLSDIHIPFHWESLLNKALDICKYERVDTIVLGGDIVDFYVVSSFTIDKTAIKITDELEALYEFLARLRRLFPRKEIIWISGNHEERLFRFIYKKADVFAPLLRTGLSPYSLFKLDKFDIRWIDVPFRIGKLYYLHGHEKKFSGQVVHAALNILRWLNRPFICGHFHRFQYFVTKEIDASLKAGMISGCMLNLKRMPTPYEKIDLQQYGFSLIKYKDELFHWDPILFIPQGKNFAVFYNSSFELV